MTYTTRSKKVDELFLPLNAGDMPKYYKGNDGKAYLWVDLEREYFAANAQTILNQIIMAIEMKQKGVLGKPCPDYVDETVSMKVVRIIQGYVNVVNKMVWRKG